jgi:hypothetical protein
LLNRLVFILVALGAGISPAQAIDLMPEDVVAPRPGFTQIQIAQIDSHREGLYVRGTNILPSAELDISQTSIRLGRSFLWAGRPSFFYALLPYGKVDPEGGPLSTLNSPSRAGDLVLTLATWPYADREQQEYVGLAAYLVLPTGNYNPENTRLINTNLGENWTRAALQAGYYRRLVGPLNWMAAFDTVWFTSNDEYYGTSPVMGKLTRRPLSTAQTALSYNFTEKINGSVNVLYTAGGNTSFDGVSNDNSVRVQRYIVSGNLLTDFGRVTLQWGGDFETESGFKEKRRLALRLTRAFP